MGKQCWIIASYEKGTGDMLYWNNADGWGERDTADYFTLQDTVFLDLPIGGFWVFVAERS